MRRLAVYFLTAMSLLSATAFAGVPQKKVKQYSCVQYERNILHHPSNKENLDKFFSKLDDLLLFRGADVNIVQIGDSHIQADVFSHRMRTNLYTMQEGLGGSRGCLFPCALANTYYNRNYMFEWGGNWNAGTNLRGTGNIELGVSGMAAWTTSPQSFLRLTLNRGDVVRWKFSRLRIFGHSPDGTVKVYAEDGGSKAEGVPTSYGWDITLSKEVESVTVHFETSAGATFVFSGMAPLSEKPSLNYFSCAVGGSSTFSWVRCPRFERELHGLEPDLVIVSLGTNDGLVGAAAFKPESFKDYYRTIVRRIRNVSSDCALIFVPSNDVSLKGSANAANNAVQTAIYELAQELGAAVWDLYDIQGGLGVVTSWKEAGLSTGDLVHMTTTGYELCADLLFNAIMRDYASGTF